MEDNISVVRHAYNVIANKYESELSDYEHKYFAQFFSSFDGLYAIDLGCGQGRIAEYCYEQKGLNVLGCDISEGMLEIANRKNKYPQSISFVLCDMQSVDSDLQFDVAIASFSFIHLTYEQTQKTLLNLRKILTDDGLIFVSLLKGNLCGYVNDPIDSSVKIFVKQYTPVEIVNLLESVKFSTIAINYGEDNDVAALSKEAMFIFAKKSNM